ncbi:MAG: MGMT family protein [Nocardioides sp.]|uniref:MGMT family protein n=1 Tax=Nocardioides sp. TaxID=35761 RepID=UPI003F106DC3
MSAYRIDPEEYAELVLRCAESVPAGHVTTYGSIAEAVGAVLGGGGPRQVGAVMARDGGGVPWWRVVRADGSLPPSHDHRARQEYTVERTPMRPGGRVDLRAAFVPAAVPTAVDETRG